MALSFLTIIEAMDSSKIEDNDESIAVIRSGLNLRSDFWEDFIRITANSQGLAELLDVSRDKVSNWAKKINDALEHIKKMDDNDSLSKKAQPI